jgi:cell division protein ZapA
LQVRSAAPAESVRRVETFVNDKLAEVAASVTGCDPQVIAILALMNMGEAYLNLIGEKENADRKIADSVSRLLNRLEENV